MIFLKEINLQDAEKEYQYIVSVPADENGFINADSVTLPFTRKYLHSDAPLEIMNFDDANDFAMQTFLDGINSMFTNDSIFGFMREAFGDADELKVEDIPLPNFDAVILLILATIKKDDPDCFYTVDFESKEKVRSQGYILPKLIFRKKKQA